MDSKADLLEALEILGEVLTSRGLEFDLVVVGGGALLIRDLIERPTMDLDVLARIVGGKWKPAEKPLPQPLVTAIREVAVTLDLPREPRDEKDWLNSGPSFIHEIGLPKGFEDRAEKLAFGSLIVRVASRQDLITLKLWAATDIRRGSRRAIDIDDLNELGPTDGELSEAIRWCEIKDGRGDFLEQEAGPVLAKLGRSPDWKPT